MQNLPLFPKVNVGQGNLVRWHLPNWMMSYNMQGLWKQRTTVKTTGTSQPTGQPYAPEKASKPPLFREVLPSGNQTGFARKLIIYPFTWMIFAAKNLHLYGIDHDLPCYKIYRRIPRSLCWITRAYPMEPVPLLHPIISAFRPQLQCQALWVDSPLRTVYQEPRWLVGQLHKAQNLSNDDTEHHGTTSHRTFKDGNNKKSTFATSSTPSRTAFPAGLHWSKRHGAMPKLSTQRPRLTLSTDWSAQWVFFSSQKLSKPYTIKIPLNTRVR